MGKGGGQLLIAPQRMKQPGKIGSSTQVWMCLVVKVKSDAVKSNIASFLLWPSFFLSGDISNCLLLFPWIPEDLWGSSSGVISFCLFILSMGSLNKNTGVGCHFFLQWTRFCQNSSLLPVCFEWPCMAMLH